MKRLISLIIAFATLAAIGCDENSDSLLTSEIVYAYRELAIFNTSEYLFSKRDYVGSLNDIPEPLVNWEQSLGEPFFDIDGDQVYDPAADVFVISDDPDSNQDLNRNGLYDGPDDPWSPGIPFDDIDGDGEFREDPGDHISGYEPGLPYADFNLNNTHDADLKAIYGIQQWASRPWSNGLTAYFISSREEAVYRFVSDSSFIYDLPFRFRSTMNAFIPKSDGLYYRFDQVLIPILPKGGITAENRRQLVLADRQDSISFERSITLDVSLTVDNVSYPHLLEVKLEDSNEQYLFYFARGDGLFAYIYRQDRSPSPGTWSDYYQAGEYFLRRLPPSHSLLFSTTR